MKVLITGVSGDGYWYSHSIGRVFDCEIMKGSRHPIRTSRGAVSNRDGELLYTESEYNQINQELLQRREQVRQQVRERESLKEELDRVRDSHPKKVVLPKEVAEAIEKLRKQDVAWSIVPNNFNLLDSINQAMRNGWKGSRLVIVIARWVVDKHERRDILVQALVNGYTIEEPQTFQTNRKLNAMEIRTLRNWYEGALMRIADGRDPDEYCKEAIEEVTLYLGGAALLEDISKFCKFQLDKENKETK